MHTTRLSTVLTPAVFPELTAGAEVEVAVRAMDALGWTDGNTAAASLTLPEAGTEVVFVDPAAGAGGDGSLLAPLSGLQAAVDALEAGSGGLIALAEGDHDTGVSTSGTVPIGFIGGFPALGTLDPGASDAELLSRRDAWLHPTVFDGRTATGDDALLDLRGEVALTGLTFVDFPATAVQATDAHLVVRESHFESPDRLPDAPQAGLVTAILGVDTTESADVSLTLLGVDVHEVDHAVRLGGAVSSLSVRNSVFSEVVDGVVTPHSVTQALAGSPETNIWRVPESTGLTIDLEHNELFRVGSGLDRVKLAPQGEVGAAAVHLRVVDNTAQAIHFGGLAAVHDLAAAGPVGVEARGNDGWGVSRDLLDLSLLTQAGIAGGDIDIRVTDNVLRHGNGDGVSVRHLGTAPGGTTQVDLRGNTISHIESYGYDLSFFTSWSSAGRLPDGAIEVDVRDTTCSPNCDAGLSVYSMSGPDTLLRVFNNDFDDSLYDGIRIYSSDVEGVDAAVDVYMAYNSVVGGFEGRAVSVGLGDGGALAFRNNVAGFNDVDSSDALYVSGSQGGAQAEVSNAILCRGAGDGVDTYDIYPHIQHVTVAGNGRDNSRSGAGIQGEATWDHSQLVAYASIADGSSATDLMDGVQAHYSLVGDGSGDGSRHTLQADPGFVEGDDPYALLAWYQLLPTSPARDLVGSEVGWTDPDGSAADAGATGGPGAGVLGPLEPGARLPLEVVGVRPNLRLDEGAALAQGRAPIVLSFNQALSTTSLSGLSVTAEGTEVAGSWTVSGRRATFTPDADWEASTDHTVHVTTDLRAADGSPHRFDWSRSWATAPASAVVESGTNADLSSADALSGRHLDVWARIDGNTELQDTFTVSASAGQELQFTAFSVREATEWSVLGGLRLALYDASGQLVKYSTESFQSRWGGTSADPYLRHTATSDGPYTVVVDLPYVAAGWQDLSSVGGWIDYRLQGWVH